MRELTVYFIGEEGTDMVKIGFTEHEDAKKRLRQLQIANPRRLWLIWQDNRGEEKYYHQAFSKNHVRGEWFRIPIDPDFSDFVGNDTIVRKHIEEAKTEMREEGQW